jgi:hypothetical protein
MKNIYLLAYSDLGGWSRWRAIWASEKPHESPGWRADGALEASNFQVDTSFFRQADTRICERNPKTICPWLWRRLLRHLWRGFRGTANKKQCPVTYVGSPSCCHIVKKISVNVRWPPIVRLRMWWCQYKVALASLRRFQLDEPKLDKMGVELITKYEPYLQLSQDQMHWKQYYSTALRYLCKQPPQSCLIVDC